MATVPVLGKLRVVFLSARDRQHITFIYYTPWLLADGNKQDEVTLSRCRALVRKFSL